MPSSMEMPAPGVAAQGQVTSVPYLAGLNPEQRAAVEAIDGPTLVLAGAGTGKTRVLTTRLAHIIVTGKAAPWQILAVTFTNKAAREMRERVGHLVDGVPESWSIGTFHAIGARILRQHAELVGLKPNFTILDTDDQQRLLRQIIQAANIDDKKWPARTLLSVISGWKDRGLTPDKVPADANDNFANGRARDLYAAYQQRLVELNACDFGDLLLHNLTLFTTQPDVLSRWRFRFRYIMVDEYQDTNVAQYLWLRLLAQEHHNICCVGDDDQSIYAWRGAEVGNILRFEKDYPGTFVVRLERNYRSTGHILGAASGLIARNEGRLGKTLWTDDELGEAVSVTGVWDDEEEARRIGDSIDGLHRAGHRLSDMAILVRASFQTRRFEERFNVIGLPYRVIGGLRFYERQEIRDALAYFRVTVQPDDDLAFERIVNKPKRGLGAATLKSVHALARAGGRSLTSAAADLVGTDELKPAARRALTRILEDFSRWRESLEIKNCTAIAETILDESGYTAMWQDEYAKHRSPEAAGRLDNLKELVAALAEFESMAGFLEHVSLVTEAADTDVGGDQVNLLTLHAAKGLEFDTVFLPGWEEGLFPHQRAMDESGLRGLEEERRLAYVGLTRARKRAAVSFAANRRRPDFRWDAAIPSRFIDELPADHISRDSQPGVYGATPMRGPGRGGSLMGAGFGARGPGLESGSGATPAGRPGRGRDGPPVIEATAVLVSESAESPFALGDRIFHQKFGYGTVRMAEGDKLRIAFDKSGEKKVVASFVVPAAEAS